MESQGYVPVSKSIQAARMIRERIERNEFGERLPGERELAERLLISRTCLRAALDRLTAEGLLGAARQGQSRKILEATSHGGDSVREVVFLTSQSTDSSDPMLAAQVARLRYFLGSWGARMELKGLSRVRPDGPQANLEKIVAGHPRAVWILHQCAAPVQRWFVAHQLPAVVLGSRFEGVDLPFVDVDYRALGQHAVNLLIRRGHRHIATVTSEKQLPGDTNCVEGARHAIQVSRFREEILFTDLHMGFSPEINRPMAQRLLRMKTMPTAFIVINENNFITLFSAVQNHGLRIPQDISFVSMVDDTALACLCPEPARYTIGDQLERVLANLVGKLAAEPGAIASPKLLLPELIPGTSIQDIS